MAEKAVYFITSEDDFISANRGKEIFEELSREVVDDMSKEIVDASSSKIDDAVQACNNTISAAATMSLFGGKKVVWMRGVNFINDTGPGRSETTKAALEKLSETLSKLTADIASVVISAAPVSKAKKFYKEMQKIAECEDYTSKDPISACVSLIEREAEKLKVKFEYGAPETLAAIVAANPRMAIQELTKLATYVNFERPITEEDVVDMVPIFGESASFEITDAFYSGNINRRMSFLTRYFFANKNASARTILSSLQRQNSLLIELRSLMDGNVIPQTTSRQPTGAIDNAAAKFGEFFTLSNPVKPNDSKYNLFVKNPWLIGSKLSPIAAKYKLKKLIDYQMAFADAFEQLIVRPSSDLSIMRDLFSQP